MIDLILESPAANGLRRKLWLRAGEVVRVGNSEWADYCLSDDPALSAVHFVVEHTGSAARVRDLNSRGGTYCNGEKKTEFCLRNGDIIQAGNTQFHAVVSERLSNVSQRSPTTSPEQALHNANGLSFQVTQLENGISNFTADDAETRNSIVDCLRQQFSLAAIIQSAAMSSLTMGMCSWIDHTQKISESLLVLPVTKPEYLVAISQLWGRDACVTVASEMPMDALIKRLQRGASTLSRCRVVRAQLLQAPEPYVDMLTAELNSILVEQANGRGWHLFSKSTSPHPWESLGSNAPHSDRSPQPC